jgi:hypothetical protein
VLLDSEVVLWLPFGPANAAFGVLTNMSKARAVKED